MIEDVTFGRDSAFQFIMLPDLTIASEKVTQMNDVLSAKPLDTLCLFPEASP